MNALVTIVFAALLPLPALAQGMAVAAQTPEPAAAESPAEARPAPDELKFLDAAEVDLDDFLWVIRPVIVFANSPADPAFAQQIRFLQDRAADLVARDVVVVTDTDPAGRSQARQRLRPRGFMLAILDKDGEVKQRKPLPWSGREVVQAIDKFPLRRQEMLEQMPAGRAH